MSSVFARPPINPLPEQSYSYERIKVEKYHHRELESSHSSPSTSSERRYEQGNSFNMAHPDTAISEQKRRGLFEVPPVRVGDEYIRPDINQRNSREQLPPLSSLFAGPQPKLPQTSYTERSPAFPAASPHISHAAPPVAAQEQRNWDPSYSQRSVGQSTTPQYSYPPRPQPAELPPPSRPVHDAPRPATPQYYESRYGQDTRTGGLNTINRWSPHSEPTFREYYPPASRDTSSSFRTQMDQTSNHRGDVSGRPSYREAGVQPPTPQYTPSSVGTVPSDPVRTKDGLGPKIWTGTQFLPRFVRQTEVPGEGLCYFYDDGTHCKAQIDGEAVNAHWGVTKAGKPRKRLAIACITCREKKIKCDPDYPRCIQCEKFGRICKFKNAPRGGQGSPESPPQLESSEYTSNRRMSEISDTESHKSERQIPQSVSPMTGIQTSPNPEVSAMKRRRNDYSMFTPVKYEKPQDHQNQDQKPKDDDRSNDIAHRCELISKLRSENPYDVDEEFVDQMIAIYFTHINSTAYYMFPEKAFIGWLRDRSIPKSEDDRVLLYGMLAVAIVFSARPDLKRRGQDYADVVRFSCDGRQFSLQTAAARVLLALHYYATNCVSDCIDVSSAAIRAATGAKLNVEIEKTKENNAENFPFNLSKDGYAECRRRTFWTCFIMDRFITGTTENLNSVHTEDIFLRFPADDLAFEEQSAIVNPFFHYAATPLHDTQGTIGSMGYLVNICTLWSEVMTKIYRTSNTTVVTLTVNPTPSCNTFYATNSARLEGWRATLPSHLTYSNENLEKAAANGILGTFLTMHLIYHTAQMKLNRVVPVSALPPTQLPSNIRVACKHANAVLDIANVVRARRSLGHNEIDSPIMGYALLGAIDILSCQGTMADAHDVARRAAPAVIVLGDLATIYDSSKSQHQLVLERVEDLKSIPKSSDGGSTWNATNGRGVTETETDRLIINRESDTFEFKNPLDVAANDCLYGATVDIWVKALAEK